MAWIATVSTEVVLFERTAAKLRARNKAGALKMVVRLTDTALANSMVIPFQFRYCRFEPSQFT